MVEISASKVMELRKASGQGMMDCKKALIESDGDIQKALDILRKKGLATLAKRAGRATSEGIVVTKSSDDGKMVILASLCCETDFVAKSNDFLVAAEQLSDYAIACEKTDSAQSILETTLDGKKFRDVLTELVSKTGEKTEVGDYAKFELVGSGLINVYVHFNKKVGTMLEIETDNDEIAQCDELKRVAADIAMHITATKPLALDKNEIDAETIEREKAIAAEQVQNKPANIIEKIVEGKMKKFFAENCLLDQPFVKDDSKTVQQVLNDAAKAGGGAAKIKKFARFEVG